ncbi:Prohibitin [Corchorus olitorius]|uniref:Prohibitin n=1 Tax=Corchorus olitorius TaxID=93759 RepID=A0A1R3KKM2_9ROSI|nr:Prohibitin [Corchorus olitorius]
MNLNDVKVPKMPGGGALPALLKLGVIGGLGVYGIANSLYNVDGGHRAIVFNRIKGIKDEVKIGLRVLTRPDAAKLPTIYRTLGENYNERVLLSFYLVVSDCQGEAKSAPAHWSSNCQ